VNLLSLNRDAVLTITFSEKVGLVKQIIIQLAKYVQDIEAALRVEEEAEWKFLPVERFFSKDEQIGQALVSGGLYFWLVLVLNLPFILERRAEETVSQLVQWAKNRRRVGHYFVLEVSCYIV
jgi:hypothetical protein